MRELSLNELEARKRLENTIVDEFRRGLMSGESEILRRSFAGGLDTGAEQVAAQEAALGSCREAFEGLEAELDGLRVEVERLSNACEDALDWINDFGQHSSIAFGGEAELANKLTKALNLPGEQ